MSVTLISWNGCIKLSGDMNTKCNGMKRFTDINLSFNGCYLHAFCLKGSFTWMDHSTYSISQWNEYVMSNISQAFHSSSTEIDIAETDLLKAEGALKMLYNGSFAIEPNETQCVAIWYKAAFQGYTPWIVLPCNQSVKTGGIFCEYQKFTNRISTTIEKPVCPLHWTYIQGSCYRLLTTDSIIGHEHMCSPDVPFSIQQTEQESLRYHVFMYLEQRYQIFITGFPLLVYAYRVRLGQSCKYFERQKSDEPYWISVHDCSVVKAVFHHIGLCPIGHYTICGFQVLQYCMSFFPLCDKPLLPPSHLEMVESDRIRYLLSVYLSKSPVHVQRDIQQPSTRYSNWTKYIMHESGELHSWTAKTSTYTLHTLQNN